MSDELLRDLARAKATFQLRAIVAHMGFPPLLDVQERVFHAVREGAVLTVSPPCRSWSGPIAGRAAVAVIVDDPALLPWVRPTLTRLRAGSAEGGEGWMPDAGMPQGS